MKRASLVIILLLLICPLIGNQIHSEFTQSLNNAKISEPSPGHKLAKYFEIENSYLEKGLLYLGIAAILLILWLLLRYKV